MIVNILTLYPDLFPGPLNCSVIGRALKNDILKLNVINIRDHAYDKHKTVDDTPYGGGAGMVLRADILARAIDSIEVSGIKYLLSPKGVSFNQNLAKEIAKSTSFTLICGRFEAIDQRVIDSRNLQELSLGDFVLSGGEIAAFAIIDAVTRLLPGVMGNKESAEDESFENNLLEYPHYTRPRLFEELPVPDILLSGNHKAIAEWRRAQAENLTKLKRPDLYNLYKKNKRTLD